MRKRTICQKKGINFEEKDEQIFENSGRRRRRCRRAKF